MPHEADFAPDVEGLQAALDRLVQVRSAPGVPHADPHVSLDLPVELPETGVGDRVALERLAAGGAGAGQPAVPWPDRDIADRRDRRR